jgi:hypothetical protein
MSDMNKLKTRFGNPLKPAEARANLRHPETPEWIDGRSLRATGRTSQLATRIHPDIHHKAKMMAARDRITMAELIEIGIRLYEEHNGDAS